jgi:adenylate kinase
MHQARAAYLIGRELGMTADVALHVQVDDRELMRRLLARAALERRSDDTADIAQPHARVVGAAQQDPGAVGRETPARHP